MKLNTHLEGADAPLKLEDVLTEDLPVAIRSLERLFPHRQLPLELLDACLELSVYGKGLLKEGYQSAQSTRTREKGSGVRSSSER